MIDSTLAPGGPVLVAAQHDACLVRRFNAGDESAFTEIVSRYRQRMVSVALPLLKNAADAEEIAQDTFVRAHRALANFRGDSSLSSWLHRIALNLARNRYWYFFRRCQHLSRSFEAPIGAGSEITTADVLASEAPDARQLAASDEFSELVTVSMARLKATQRDILQRRNVAQLSYRQIARDLGISIGTVKSRVTRAREALRVLVVTAYTSGPRDRAAGLARTAPDVQLTRLLGPAPV